MVNFSVFNEKSLPLTKGKKTVDAFGEFFCLLSELKNKGLNQIRMSDDFKYCNVLDNTSFQQFLGQQGDREFKARLKSFITNSIITIDTPMIKKEEWEQKQKLDDCEYFYKAFATDGGLACCDVWNTLAVSFNSKAQWNSSVVMLAKDTIENDEIIREEITIKHASQVCHLTEHQKFFDVLEFENRLHITQNTFWCDKSKNFPNIIHFCVEVEAQIKNLDAMVFKQAIGLLRDVETKRKSIFDFHYSSEGESVKNNPRLKEMRMFTIDGSKVFFTYHVKSLPHGNRIYFLEKDEKLFIGYIGKHLSTKKY